MADNSMSYSRSSSLLVDFPTGKCFVFTRQLQINSDYKDQHTGHQLQIRVKAEDLPWLGGMTPFQKGYSVKLHSQERNLDTGVAM